MNNDFYSDEKLLENIINNEEIDNSLKCTCYTICVENHLIQQ